MFTYNQVNLNFKSVKLEKIGLMPRHLTLLTAGLGYLGNVFCVNLTYVFKKEPFLDFGIAEAQLASANSTLLIIQHVGIFLGVILFGSLADRRGRMAMLFISVGTYSVATFLSGLVHNYYLFQVLRFVVGLGVASELGIGLVLICEIFSREKRTFLIIFIAFCGFMGMFLLSILAKSFHWRTLYIMGGLLGLLIMFFRFSTFESDIFLKSNQLKNQLKKSLILPLLRKRKIYYLIICILPSYLVTASSIFVGTTYFKELKVSAGQSLLFFSIGGGLGLIFISLLSKKIKSRKKAITLCITLLLILASIYAFIKPTSIHSFLIINFLFGIFVTYQFELLALTIEQFGTNIRALATTLVFGAGRASVFLFSLIIPILNLIVKDLLMSVFILDFIFFCAALWAISKIKEDFCRDLSFVDE